MLWKKIQPSGEGRGGEGSSGRWGALGICAPGSSLPRRCPVDGVLQEGNHLRADHSAECFSLDNVAKHCPEKSYFNRRVHNVWSSGSRSGMHKKGGLPPYLTPPLFNSGHPRWGIRAEVGGEGLVQQVAAPPASGTQLEDGDWARTGMVVRVVGKAECNERGGVQPCG